MDDRPRDYREEELRRALAADPGVGELELDVRIDHDRVIIAGVLPTAERRDAVHRVIGELAPDLRVVDDTTTPRFVPADQEERME
jgi:hypothetical protein